MAIGKAGVELNLNKLSLKIGDFKIIANGKIFEKYEEDIVKDYMSNNSIEIVVDIFTGKKLYYLYYGFNKKYIEINADYRS